MMSIALSVGTDTVMGDRLRGDTHDLPVGVDRMDVPPAGADPSHVWPMREDALPAEAYLMGDPPAWAEVKWTPAEEANHAHEESLISTRRPWLVTPRLPKDVIAKLITGIQIWKSKETPQRLLNRHRDPCLVLVA